MRALRLNASSRMCLSALTMPLLPAIISTMCVIYVPYCSICFFLQWKYVPHACHFHPFLACMYLMYAHFFPIRTQKALHSCPSLLTSRQTLISSSNSERAFPHVPLRRPPHSACINHQELRRHPLPILHPSRNTPNARCPMSPRRICPRHTVSKCLNLSWKPVMDPNPH